MDNTGAKDVMENSVGDNNVKKIVVVSLPETATMSQKQAMGPAKEKMQTGLAPTRHSSKIQDDGRSMLEKAMEKKAKSDIPKGKSSIPNLIPKSSVQIEELARVCGISLGENDSARIANISMLQAKEEALLALQETKQKLMLSSGENLEVESGSVQDGKELRDTIPTKSVTEGDIELVEINLFTDQG